MKQEVEMNQSLSYKLTIFGIRLTGPASVYCDNEAVYKNVFIPESSLKKKHHFISYHYCREAVSSDMKIVEKEYTMTNLADLFTKIMPKVVRDRLLDMFKY